MECRSGMHYAMTSGSELSTCYPAEWVFARSLLEVVEERAANGRLGATELAQATAACCGVFR